MFAENLKRIMSEKGYNVTKLSKETKIGKSSISQYVNGKNFPNDEYFNRIVKTLNVDPEQLSESKIDIESRTKEKVYNLSVRQAAKLLGTSYEFVRNGLIEGIFPWGYAVKMSSVWTFYINSKSFFEIEKITERG